MIERVEILNHQKEEPFKKDNIRDKIDKQQEVHRQIKKQINTQIEKCNLLLSKLN